MLAWAAGFFDGEGSITCTVGEGSRAIHVEITQAGDEEAPPDTLVKFHSAVGGIGLIRRKKRYGTLSKKPLWRWGATSFMHAQAAIGMLWLWLGESKRAKAIQCLTKYKSRQPQSLRPVGVMGGPRMQLLCSNGHDKNIHGFLRYDGRGRDCRICANERARQWRFNNPDLAARGKRESRKRAKLAEVEKLSV